MVERNKTTAAKHPQWVVTFGQELERARGYFGLTQAGLAGSDLSKSFVSLLETARSYPSVDSALLLARRSGASLAALLLDPGELRLDTALSLVSLARGAATSRPAWARNLVRTAEELTPDMPLWLKGEAVLIHALASVAESKPDEAEALSRQGLGLAERAQFVPGQARALALLGLIALIRRDFAGAFGLLSQAVARHRESSSLRSESGIKALIWLGTVSIKIGRSKHAKRMYEKALRLSSRLELTPLKGEALLGLGYLAKAEGDLASATQIVKEARTAFEQTEDVLNLSAAMNNLGALYREQGELDKALGAMQQAIRLMDRAGNLRARSASYEEMARVYLQLGDLDEAHKAARQALEDANQAGDRQHRAHALAALGRVAATRRQRSRAIRYLREAVRLFKTLGLRDARDEALVIWASCFKSRQERQKLHSTLPRPSERRRVLLPTATLPKPAHGINAVLPSKRSRPSGHRTGRG